MIDDVKTTIEDFMIDLLIINQQSIIRRKWC